MSEAGRDWWASGGKWITVDAVLKLHGLHVFCTHTIEAEAAYNQVGSAGISCAQSLTPSQKSDELVRTRENCVNKLI
jgi:hypothetical protein